MEEIKIIPTGEATGIIKTGQGKPITVIGTKKIREGFENGCLQQAINSSNAPGVTDLILNPDAHFGYGAPVGSVLVSPTHIYPGPVGVDVKCSMSLLQLDLPAEEIRDKTVRRSLIKAILERTPTGPGQGQRSAPKSKPINDSWMSAITTGASKTTCEKIGIPEEWAASCEDASCMGHDGTTKSLNHRLQEVLDGGLFRNFGEKMKQLGSYGGGNHFGECEVVEVQDDAKETANMFGLKDGHVAFLSHCGSRGFGNILATSHFRQLGNFFKKWSIPFPGDDRQLVYAPLETLEADLYLDDMALAANFATVNHLIINTLVLEAFQEVIPGVNGDLVYLISHNMARREILGNKPCWVHRKGATRAFPARHHALKGTRFYEVGHPILLPGNPVAGSVVMVAKEGAEKSCYSINHGAGRCMGRKAAKKALEQDQVDKKFDDCDILFNGRQYPIDEAPGAYKDFTEVLRSVEGAGLARTVAKLRAKFVIKDASKADD